MMFSSGPGEAGRTADHPAGRTGPSPRPLTLQAGAGAAAAALLLSSCGVLDADGQSPGTAEPQDQEATPDEAGGPAEAHEEDPDEEIPDEENPEDGDADESDTDDGTDDADDQSDDQDDRDDRDDDQDDGGEPEGSDEDSEEDLEEDPEEDRDPAEPAVVEETVWDFGEMEEVQLQVTVHPFVREEFDGEDYLSGVIDYEILGSSGELQLDDYGMHPASTVQLVDTEELTTGLPVIATDGEQTDAYAALEDSTARAGGGPVSWVGSHADLGSDQVAVLLPYVGLIEGVGVLDPEEAEDAGYIPLAESQEELIDIEPRVWDLEVYRERAEGDLNIREEDGRSTISLDSEVLFGIEEYDLTDEADEALDAAAEELERADGGELEIIGHTDDVRSEEFNQELSENRAEAVYDRLDELTDLSDFEITTEGRNFQEPVADNESEEGRALNRRVEVRFTPPEEEVEDLDELVEDLDGAEGDLPEAEGPVSEEGDALTVEAADGREAEVSLDEVRRVDNVLVGRVSVETTEHIDGEDHAGLLSWPVSFGESGARDEHDHQFTEGTQTDALTLLLGDTRVFPLEFSGEGYVEDDGGDEDGLNTQDYPWHMPLTDRGFGHGADAEAGTRATATVIWPAVPGETVTVDVPGETEHAHRPHSDPFRFLEVPVDGAETPDEEED